MSDNDNDDDGGCGFDFGVTTSSKIDKGSKLVQSWLGVLPWSSGALNLLSQLARTRLTFPLIDLF